MAYSSGYELVFHVWTLILVYVCSRWPLEMHLVHYDRQFKKLSEAAKRKNGLAVLAVFFYVSIEHNVYSRMHLKDNLVL
jgi:fucose permease